MAPYWRFVEYRCRSCKQWCLLDHAEDAAKLRECRTCNRVPELDAEPADHRLTDLLWAHLAAAELTTARTGTPEAALLTWGPTRKPVRRPTRRGGQRAAVPNPIPYPTGATMADLSLQHTGEDYEYVRCRAGDSDDTLSIHRLLYVAAHGLDDFPPDWHVHHEIPIPWLNVPSNLVAVDPDAHGRHHLHDASLAL